MFKRAFAMVFGAALLTSVATGDSRAAGLTLGPDLQAEATPFAAVDILQGTATSLFPGGFEFDGITSDLDSVSIVRDLLGDFTFTITGSTAPRIIGTSEKSLLTNKASGDELEILFNLSSNDGSLTTASLALVSITGNFGSDPFGLLGTSTLPDTFSLGGFSGQSGAAGATFRAVNQVPLPAGMVLLLTALGGLILVRRRSA